MRRSSAPSQNESSAKRGRFCTPFVNTSLQETKILNEKPKENAEKTTKKADFQPQNVEQQPKRSTLDVLKLIENVESSRETCSNPAPILTASLQASPGADKNLLGGEDKSPAVKYFNVVWGKLSARKHKKWEGDAILVVKQSTAVLKDMEGKTIGTGSNYKMAQLEGLEDGCRLVVGGKEVELAGTVSKEDYDSGRCFQSVANLKTENRLETSGATPKPFQNPLMDATAKDQPIKRQLVEPRFDPTKPDALVLPRPSPSHQWQFNASKRQLIDVVIDPLLSKKLRPHQKEGVIFLYKCIMKMGKFNGEGAILADEMGLGKTLQCIALIWTLLKQGPYGGVPVLKRVLIVTPSSLMKNWSKEFNTWLGQERIRVFTADQSDKIEAYVKCPIQPVLITSYELIMRQAGILERVPFGLVVCDEGHRLKNAATKTSALLTSLPIKKRIVLTGTPIQNDLQEFYALVHFCNPGILGSMKSFRKIYEEPILRSRQPDARPSEIKLGKSRADELSRVTGQFILRRTQDVNNEYLPPKVEYVVFCKPTALQSALYERIIATCSVQGIHRDGSYHLTCITALKKLCGHPGLLHQAALDSDDSPCSGLGAHFPPDFRSDPSNLRFSGKLLVLASFLENLRSRKQPSERVVLVSLYTKTLDLLQLVCEGAGYSFLRLDGSTPTGQRQELVDRYNAPYSDVFIFLLSLKAGGVGLNLIGASRIVLLDIDWNPANDLQAMSRVWRDGQKKTVHIYRFLTTGTIEEKIYQRQITKHNLSGALVDSKENKRMQFTPEELKDLFTLNTDTPCNTHDLLECDCQSTDPSGASGILDCDIGVVPIRPGQLSLTKNWNKSKNLSMDELMSWEHIGGESFADYQLQESCLAEANDHISFIFRNFHNSSVARF